MKHFLLLLMICFSFYELPAQVKNRPLPTEQKSEAKVDVEDQSMSVYPNPTNGVITISLEGFEGEKTDLRIMNVIGNVVYREVIQDPASRYMKTIDLNKLSKGLYYVKLETPTYSEVRKVILR
ncbi:T9SS C-terminal target domain-containing protein [Rufibacter immobilis]|uniref:T9SS C-terminal target domain-containing protein n=1 Tax=Rufibacter immobilis TaxID=1348778 RepID=A0A3M9MWY5_9BACT|nr:T9SS type A sorting domain-containing protein [Rufibacter immobilis]RNI30054.1 T9SS C-terminal target domain-containing protein [Rufibacter immobilis]